MAWSANSSTFGMPSGQGDDEEGASQYDPTWPQQYALVMSGDSFCSEEHSVGVSYRESSVPAAITSSTRAWTDVFCPDSSSSVYGCAWPSHQRIDEIHLQSLSGALEGISYRSGVSPMELEVAAPLLEQAFPAAPRASPAFHAIPPSPDWNHLGSTLLPTSSWHPVHNATQHSAHSISTGSCGMRTENSTSQLVASPVTTGFDPRVAPIGYLPFIHNSVQDSAQPDSASPLSSAPRPRGQRWYLSKARRSLCMWASRESPCAALVAGDRRSVSSHLRDEHDFSCDSEVTACEWDGCTSSPMQRRNIPRHIISCHLEVKVPCSLCGFPLSRADANRKHQKVCMVKIPAVMGNGQDKGSYS